MKKLILLISMFLVLTFSLKAQWNKYLTGQLAGIKNVSVINDNVVWVMAENKVSVSYTLDGGVTWITKTLPTNISNKCGGFCAVNSTTAYIVVYSGAKGIYKTTDGADTWTLQTTGFNQNSPYPDFVYFWNENEGVAVGDASPNENFEIYTTSNGGVQWNLVPYTNMPSGNYEETTNTNQYYKVHGNTFYFITNKGRIFKSTDKGLNWSVINTPETSEGNKLSFDFKDENNGLLSKTDFSNILYSTSDGGVNWTSVAVSDFIGYIYYIPSQNVYLSSDYYLGLCYSTDNGQTWTKHPSFNYEGVLGISYSNSGKIFMGGGSYIYSSFNYLSENTTLNNIIKTSSTTLDFYFSANVEQTSAENTSNYTLFDGTNYIDILSATRDMNDNSIVHIITQTELPLSRIYFWIEIIYGTNGFPVLGKFIPDIIFSDIKENQKNTISIYPNPAINVVNINGLEPNSLISIYDISGKLVFSGESSKANKTIDINNLSKGLYTIKIINSSYQNITKFVKE